MSNIKMLKELGKMVEWEREAMEAALEAEDSLASMKVEYDWAVNTSRELEKDPNADVENPYFGGIYRKEAREGVIAWMKKVLVIYPEKKVEMEDLIEKRVKNWEMAREALNQFRDKVIQGDG